MSKLIDSRLPLAINLSLQVPKGSCKSTLEFLFELKGLKTIGSPYLSESIAVFP